jgi:hypothetical protein
MQIALYIATSDVSIDVLCKQLIMKVCGCLYFQSCAPKSGLLSASINITSLRTKQGVPSWTLGINAR